MKIALPSKGQQIDGHFGHCESFTVFTVDSNQRITSQETLTPPAGCGCKSSIIPQLADMGVKVMLAGNMGDGAVNLLSSHGISVVRGCAGTYGTWPTLGWRKKSKTPASVAKHMCRWLFRPLETDGCRWFREVIPFRAAHTHLSAEGFSRDRFQPVERLPRQAGSRSHWATSAS